MVENLILWRHAEAETQSVTGKDSDRALTKRGKKDALKIAEWLKQHLPKNTKILCSPARRCIETAAYLEQINVESEVKIVDFLGVDNSVNHIVQNLLNAGGKTILAIGHQPNLGLLIEELLDMQEGTCVVKKGAVWWLRQRNPLASASDRAIAPQTYLFTVQHPDYL